ncbi:MAG TPA: CDGSH iron-sulfur domain-containing protein [Candidatus Nanopelagicaceae bacterium]
MSDELDVKKVTIQVRPNGSLRVTGTVDFVDAEGKLIRTDTNFSLCRCGHSQDKPFCDGSHRAAGFQAPAL